MRTRIVTAIAFATFGVLLARCSSSSSTDVTDAGRESSAGDGANESGSGDDGSPGDDGSAGGCQPGCLAERHCCGTQCKNLGNDPLNCNGCGIQCPTDKPYCDGVCKVAPCDPSAPPCAGGATCCGTVCCAKGDICCRSDDATGGTTCHTPTKDQPSCPAGCKPICK